MKKLVVSNACEACGLCLDRSKLLVEGVDGKTVVAEGGIISEDELKTLQAIIEDCPVGAISIKEASNTKATGAAGVQEILALLEKPFACDLPNREIYKFTDRDIPIPFSPRDYNYDYKSSDKAQSEGLREFDRIMYSQKVALVQQVIIKYKNEVLLPYIRYENKKGNFYYDRLCEFTLKLKEYIAELEEKLGHKLDLPSDIYEFKILNDKWMQDMFRDVERWGIDQSWAKCIAGAIDPLSSYEAWVDTDDTTVYVRKSHFFGDDTYDDEDRYCFKLNDVCKELAKDINFQCHLDLDTYAQDLTETNIRRFSEDLNKEWRAKVNLIKNACRS